MAKKPTPNRTSKPAVKRTTGQKIKRFLWLAFLWFNGINFLIVLLFKFVPVPFTPLMGIRAMEHKKEGREMTCSHEWVPIDEISLNLQKAVIASEDGRFLDHWGFDFEAMKKAFKNNQKGRKIKAGALFHNKRQKMCFYGKVEVMCAKPSKLTILF